MYLNKNYCISVTDRSGIRTARRAIVSLGALTGRLPWSNWDSDTTPIDNCKRFIHQKRPEKTHSVLRRRHSTSPEPDKSPPPFDHPPNHPLQVVSLVPSLAARRLAAYDRLCGGGRASFACDGNIEAMEENHATMNQWSDWANREERTGTVSAFLQDRSLVDINREKNGSQRRRAASSLWSN